MSRNFFAIFVKMFNRPCASFYDQVHKLVLDVDDLDDLLALALACDLLLLERLRDDGVLLAVHGHDDRTAQLAEHLHPIMTLIPQGPQNTGGAA